MSGAEPSARRYAAREISRDPPTSVLIVGARVLLLQREATHTKRGTSTRASMRQLSSPHFPPICCAGRATSAPGVYTGGDRSVDGPVLPVPGKRLHRVHVCLVCGLRSPRCSLRCSSRCSSRRISPTRMLRSFLTHSIRTLASRAHQAKIAAGRGEGRLDRLCRVHTPSTSSCVFAVRSASSLSASALDRAPRGSLFSPKNRKGRPECAPAVNHLPQHVDQRANAHPSDAAAWFLPTALSGLLCTPAQAQKPPLPLQGFEAGPAPRSDFFPSYSSTLSCIYAVVDQLAGHTQIERRALSASRLRIRIGAR
ncbi:hypothetical protein DFH08DRAFT_426095 [Mycena albidolilacea]|uniref:Uncharacterized protein n=1 Tax=Mycena albidolilacea TaxID=1033008 RepID=A0AAD6ZCB9_9AGAR|nr:hypothetical protein DFH08DRAFT_426095 [Mycena albidolilacea]